MVIEPLTDDDWRSVRLSELNFKPKLQERLEEAGVDTIGRLEDLRAEISQGREKWPKGIGKAKITEIEDAVINWLSKNRDAQILAQAKASTLVEAQHPVENEQPAATMSEENGEESIEQRAKAIQAAGTAGLAPVTCTIDDSKGPYASGVEAQDKGWSLTDCPYVPGPEQDDWLRGWLASQSTDGLLHPEEIHGPSDSPAEDASHQVKEPSLDDL